MINLNCKKWFVFLLMIVFVSPIFLSCKSKKKCPDFTNVGGKVKVDKNGLAKKKKIKQPKSDQGY